MVTHYETDFVKVLKKLKEYYSNSQIVSFSGLSSTGHVADYASGRKTSPRYDVGVLLVAEYQRLVDAERNKKGVKK